MCKCPDSIRIKHDLDYTLRSCEGWVAKDKDAGQCIRQADWGEYRRRYNEYTTEFALVKKRLRNANTTVQPGDPEVTLDKIARFDVRLCSESTTALEYHHSKSPIRSKRCACYIPTGPNGQVREAWLHERQNGIICDKMTRRSCEAVHQCRRLPLPDSAFELRQMPIVVL